MRAVALAFILLAGWPAFANGTYPKQRVYIHPSFCTAKLELEIPPTTFRGPVVLASGLAPGDCVELDAMLKTRLCCSTVPRKCGALAQPIPTPVCKRVVRP
jgi:hypothetical protein